jgi:hypothetical protein
MDYMEFCDNLAAYTNSVPDPDNVYAPGLAWRLPDPPLLLE